MQIFETSLIELFLWPLKKLKMFHIETLRSAHHYEHAYTGFTLCAISSFIPWPWLRIMFISISFILHVILKELIIDSPKNKLDPVQGRIDLVVRIYGFIMGLPFLLKP